MGGSHTLAGSNSSVDPKNPLTLPNIRPAGVTFGDVDFDGNDELVVALSDFNSSLNPPGNGSKLIFFRSELTDTTFLHGLQPAKASFNAYGPFLLAIFPAALTTGAKPAVNVALAVPNLPMDVYLTLLRRDKDVDFMPVPLPPYVPASTRTMTVADLDGDGAKDLVFGGTGTIGSDAGNNPTFGLTAFTQVGQTNQDRTFIPTVGYAFGLQAIDWNLDGRVDLFAWIQPKTALGTVVPTLLQNRGKLMFQLTETLGMSTRGSVVTNAPIDSPAVQSCPPRLVFTDTSSTIVSVFSP